MKKIVPLIIISLTLVSCFKDNIEKYPVTFSQTFVQFDKVGGNKVIESLNDEWSFKDSLNIDDKTLYFPRCEEVFLNTEPTIHNSGTCSDSVLTVKYDIMLKDLEPVQIKGSWFTISKKSLRELSIIISPNLSDKTRTLMIMVDNYATAIYIIQSSN